MRVAIVLMYAFLAYAGLGVLFAVPFVSVGAGRIDPAARTGPLGFRMIIFPASVGLWPYLAVRWARVARGGRDESRRSGAP